MEAPQKTITAAPIANSSAAGVLRPESEEALQEVVRTALARQTPLEVLGGGTKRDYGPAAVASRSLSTTALRGIVDYQPAELMIVLRPGTPIEEVNTLLASENQTLAFEPPQWNPKATIGGVIGCNLSGPRRFKAGAARDHLLGFRAICGRGKRIQGGGRVMKNVTGYDLSKLICGSFGTLAVFSELILKVWPRAEASCTQLVRLTSWQAAQTLLMRATSSPQEVSGAAYLPPETRPQETQHWAKIDASPGEGIALLRLEGGGLANRLEKLRRTLDADPPGQAKLHWGEVLDAETSRTCWNALAEARPLWPTPPKEGRPPALLWRCVLRADALATFCKNLLRSYPEAQLCVDWGGTLVWVALDNAPTEDEATARKDTVKEDTAEEDPARALQKRIEVRNEAIQRLAQRASGLADLVRGGGWRSSQPLLAQPAEGAHQRLQQNLKRAFDPQEILNPERLFPRT